MRDYGIELGGIIEQWDDYRKRAIYLAVQAVGERYAKELGGNKESAFRRVYKRGIELRWGTSGLPDFCEPIGGGACTASSSLRFLMACGDSKTGALKC